MGRQATGVRVCPWERCDGSYSIRCDAFDDDAYDAYDDDDDDGWRTR